MSNTTISPLEFEVIYSMRRSAKELQAIMDEYVALAEKIVGSDSDELFEYIWNGGSLTRTLKNIGVTVEKQE